MRFAPSLAIAAVSLAMFATASATSSCTGANVGEGEGSAAGEGEGSGEGEGAGEGEGSGAGEGEVEGGAIGDLCATDAECGAGLACTDELEAPNSICEPACSVNTDCAQIAGATVFCDQGACERACDDATPCGPSSFCSFDHCYEGRTCLRDTDCNAGDHCLLFAGNDSAHGFCSPQDLGDLQPGAACNPDLQVSFLCP